MTLDALFHSKGMCNKILGAVNCTRLHSQVPAVSGQCPSYSFFNVKTDYTSSLQRGDKCRQTLKLLQSFKYNYFYKARLIMIIIM